MKPIITKLLKKSLKEEGVKLKEEEIESLLGIPPSLEMGDYSFPVFSVAKQLKQDPKYFALEVRANIGTPPKEISEIQTIGGYINFFIDRKTFAQNLIIKILQENENYGKFDIGKAQTALIEHTSINPNASPHVGRARNAMIGDSLVSILKFFNYKTEVHYYVNDVSKQIAMLVLAGADKLSFDQLLKKYIEISKKVKKSKKLEQQVFDILYKFEKGDKNITKKFHKIVKTSVKGQQKILEKLGIYYDYFDYESDYIKKSGEILSKLEKTKKLFKDKDGRFVLDQKGTSVVGKMKSPVLVLTRNDGTGLYPLRDLAYTIDKLKKTKENIIVLGEDQKLYFQQLKEALNLLEVEAPEVIHYSFISLAEKSGKSKGKKMSTRKGNVVLLEDFLEKAIKKAEKEIKKRNTKGDPKKVAVGAVKYAILKNNPNRPILFNLDDVLNFEGDTGPYILYSYARASSILKKASKLKTKKGKIKVNEFDAKEFELVNKISQFPKIVMNSYKHLNPALIANYSYELAKIFNEFYHCCPVISSEADKQAFRLALVESFRITLKNSMNLLGIDVIEEM